MEEAKEDDKGKEGDKVVEAGVGDLALELFLHIVGFLEPADLVRVEAVQRAWADALRHDDHTWRTVFRAHLGQGPSRPTTAARGSWRSRCVKAARRAHQTANRADLTPEARALELLKVACACGLHRLCARVLADGCQFRSAETFDYAGSGLYPLHLAVASGSTATVQVLAETGFNVHQRNASGVTPIGAAVQTGQLDLVEVLLRHGASSEELSQLTGGGGGGDGRGGAPKGKGKVKRKNTIPILHQAAAAGHTRIVQVLLDLARQGKGTTFHRDDEGAAASAADAEGGSKDDKEDGDEGDAKYLNVPDRFGNTPLRLAVEEDREAMVRFLVAKGADVNQVHRVTRLAPLHWAVKHNKLSTARLLLELGAANEPVRSIDQQYLVTVPPFFLACECQLPDMVQLFLEHFGSGIMDAVVPHSSMTSTPLLRVLQLIQCRKEFVEFLLAKGANVRATTGGSHPKDALTCLLQCLEQRCKPSAEIVALLEMLIDAIGLPMDHRADLLETTASYSFAKENPAETEEHFKHVRDMFDLLVAKGVQVPRHETNIMVIVAQHGSVDMVRFFLDKGVHIDARHRGLDPTLKSLLGYWRFERDMERTMDLLKFFLENGADPNQRNDRGETACFWVGKQGQALELLVKHGADVNVTNEEGCTPLTKLLYQLHELNFRYLSTQTTFDELADLARLFVRLGADPKLGGDPYRRILHEVVSRPSFAPEWLALVAELGVPIDTESPLPDSDHEEDEAPAIEETTS